MSGPLPAPERVLPTLNQDGTRRLIRPRVSKGRFHQWRRMVGWVLIVLFVAIPFIRLNGKPLILLDVAHREFTLFGRTFLSTDGVLLMLLMLGIFIGIVWITALVGRAWCGWGCPQTVYLEYLFRPLEYLIEGGRTRVVAADKKGAGARRVLKYAVFAVLSVALANVFLAYFVGVDRLFVWMQQSPLEHPSGFLVVAVVSGLVFFDFAYFREQMCTVICPYARLQSVLLDPKSLVIGYDGRRGEPRGRGPEAGDCIDCFACVRTCPTGIDIRDGLQLECVACAQCIDACDAIMDRVGKPRGLIRYGTQEGLDGDRAPSLLKRVLRPRTLIYPVVLLAIVGALIAVGGDRNTHEVTVLRGIGAPYTVDEDQIRNQLRIKIHNRSEAEADFRIRLSGLPEGNLIIPQNPLRVEAGDQITTTLFVEAPTSVFVRGKRDVTLSVSTDSGFEEELPYKLLGPFGSVK